MQASELSPSGLSSFVAEAQERENHNPSALEITAETAVERVRASFAGLAHRSAKALDKWEPSIPKSAKEGLTLVQVAAKTAFLDQQTQVAVGVQITGTPWSAVSVARKDAKMASMEGVVVETEAIPNDSQSDVNAEDVDYE